MKKLALVVIICSIIVYLKINQDEIVIPEDTLNYIDSLPELRQSHKSNILKLISSQIGLDISTEQVEQEDEFIAMPKNNENSILKSELNNKKLVLEKEIKELERAIKTLDGGIKEYQTIRVKIFPVERTSRIKKGINQFTSIENNNLLNVQEIDWTTGKVVKQHGEFKKIEFYFEDPTNLLSEKNKLMLTKDSFSNLGKEELSLGKLKSSSSSILISPTNSSRLESLAHGSTDDQYFKAGFSKVNFGKNNNHFYRGSFEINYAHRYLTSRARIWTVVNLVDMYDYMHSVISSELREGRGNTEAKKAQVIAARTYAVLKASEARTKKYNPRTWDLLPTTAHQVYPGVKAEIKLFEKVVRDTKNKILVVESESGLRPAFTEYFGCTNQRTLDDHNPPRKDVLIEQEPRQVPSLVDCQYAKGKIKTKKDVGGTILAYGHGRGMCQKCAIHLAHRGWDDPNKKPTESGAVVPYDIRSPWMHNSILMYFYNQTRIESMDEVL